MIVKKLVSLLLVLCWSCTNNNDYKTEAGNDVPEKGNPITSDLDSLRKDSSITIHPLTAYDSLRFIILKTNDADERRLQAEVFAIVEPFGWETKYQGIIDFWFTRVIRKDSFTDISLNGVFRRRKNIFEQCRFRTNSKNHIVLVNPVPLIDSLTFIPLKTWLTRYDEVLDCE